MKLIVYNNSSSLQFVRYVNILTTGSVYMQVINIIRLPQIRYDL
jgi:hypothetical protein